MPQKPPYLADSIATPTAHGLGASVVLELEKRNLPGVCDGGLMPGAEVAFDACGQECPGIWWVRVGQVYPSVDFPTQDALSHGRRPVVLAQVYEVGLVRGMRAPRRAEDAPEIRDLGEAAEVQMADMRAMLQAICGYFKEKATPFVIGAYTPYGPQGFCAGGSWTVTAGLAGSD